MNKKAHIVIINKSEFDRKILQRVLHSYEVTFYDKVAVAQTAIGEEAPALILIDGEFGSEGFTFCKTVVANHSSADIPVMFLFAADDREGITSMFQCGGSDYISKPFNQIEIASRVHIHMSHVRQKKELESLANYDPMTQTYNRRTFFEHANKAMAFSNSKKLTLHLILFHFHSLNKINETYGYFAGDKIITDVSSIIKEVLTEKSIVGRLNGNSFAVVVTGKTGRFLSELASSITDRTAEINIEKHYPVVVEYVIAERYSVKESIDDMMLEASKKLEECEVARTKRNY